MDTIPPSTTSISSFPRSSARRAWWGGYSSRPLQDHVGIRDAQDLNRMTRSCRPGLVLVALARWVDGVARRTADRVEATLRTAARPASLVGGLLRDVVRSREELIAENTLLRQQLIVAARTVKKPRFAACERGLLVILAGLVPRWRDALLVVKPDTILRWHREGFRLFWRARSRPPEASVPRVSPETLDLIRRLADDNRLWGAERIRGELLKLGIRVAKRTIQKHMRRLRGPRPWGQSWSTFLENHLHQTWSCDFLQLYEIWFRPIFAFFIIELGSRKVVHLAVTRHPSTTWVAQQLRNATPFGDGPRCSASSGDRSAHPVRLGDLRERRPRDRGRPCAQRSSPQLSTSGVRSAAAVPSTDG
jgi:hypothetical protein